MNTRKCRVNIPHMDPYGLLLTRGHGRFIKCRLVHLFIAMLQKKTWTSSNLGGGGVKYFLCSPLPFEMIQFD